MADRYLLESSLVDGYLLEDGSGVLLLETGNPVPPATRRVWADGHAGVLLMGAAIGAAMVWGETTALNAPITQPTPQAAQWEQASRDLTQIQPLFSRGIFPVAAVAAQPVEQFFAAPQADPTQLQPQFWRAFFDRVSTSPGQGTASPLQDQFQPSPWFSRQQLTSAAVAPQPIEQWFTPGQADPTQTQPSYWKALPGNLAPATEQWFATRQDDPTQLQPQFWRQQLTSAAVAPQPVEQWFTPAQADTTQVQPQIWRAQLTSVAVQPQPFGQWFTPPQADTSPVQPGYWHGQFPNVSPVVESWFSTRQDDPSQTQPTMRGQFPPSQATETPSTRPWFARPQDDPSQIQPVIEVAGASQIPSQPTPPPVPDDGGAAGLGDYAAKVVAQRRQFELEQQLDRQRQSQRAAEQEVSERERAIVRARSEKTKERERVRLAKAVEQQAKQERLVELIAQELSVMIAAQEQADASALHALTTDEEDAILLLLLT